LKLNKDENAKGNRSHIDIATKLSLMKTNILNKSSNEDLEDILSKYKKTKIFLKNASIDPEKNTNNLDFLDNNTTTKDFAFISNRKYNGVKNNEINTVAVQEDYCDYDVNLFI